MSEVPLYPRKIAGLTPPSIHPSQEIHRSLGISYGTVLGRALPAETKVESGTSQSKSGTYVNLSNSGFDGPVEIREEASELRVRRALGSNLDEGSYLRRIDSCITQLKAQGPSRICNESKEEEEEGCIGRPRSGCGVQVQGVGYTGPGSGCGVQGPGL